MSLEVDVCKHNNVSFGGLSCSRAEDSALPSFLASMNSVGELVETILSRINIADANVFHILVAAAGGWTVEVCMACPANTVLAAIFKAFGLA